MAGFVVLDISQEDYDAAIRAKAIDEFAERMKELSDSVEISVFGWNRIVDEIADQLKEGAE